MYLYWRKSITRPATTVKLANIPLPEESWRISYIARIREAVGGVNKSTHPYYNSQPIRKHYSSFLANQLI